MTQHDKPRHGKPKPDAHKGVDASVESGRIAKILARAGVASRRDAERMIAEGRVKVNGKVLDSPAVVVSLADRIEVDGQEIAGIERTRLWIYHKPAGLVTTNRDPEGRRTVFDALPGHLPRVLSIGRLDINTEGLLLLTNDGGLARTLELPETGWLRRYRVRAHGDVDQARLDELKDGIAVDGVLYGAIEATLDRKQGHNVWITMGLREGKNREIKNVLGALGLDVNRLIRISFGPFQLGEIGEGEVVEIKSRTLRDQLGARLIEQSGANFDAPLGDQARKTGSGAPSSDDDKPTRTVKPAEREWISASDKTERARARLDTKPARSALETKTSGRGRGLEGGKPDKARGGRPAAQRTEESDGKPARRGFIQRNRSANVWMAPGARPQSEAKRAEAEANGDRTGRKPARADARAETRRGSFPKGRAKPRPDREDGFDTSRSKTGRGGGGRADGDVRDKAPGGKPAASKGASKPGPTGPRGARQPGSKPATRLGSKPAAAGPARDARPEKPTSGKPASGKSMSGKSKSGKGHGPGADRRR